ncbi:MAG: T9SS type A sorting domain-containing protein [Luteibaculaceae bacterium]
MNTKYFYLLLFWLIGYTASAQITFPVTFENANPGFYQLVDFGGTSSVIVADPENPDNNVVQTTKGVNSATWAGTSVAAQGFAQPIPFNAQNTIMTLRVRSPQANIPVMLKVEQVGDPTVFVEMAATVPTANEWVTLTFDVTNERPGTAAVNFASTYNFASVFFNIDVEGEGLTYFWDDLDFPGGTGSGGGGDDPVAGITLPITFDDEEVDYELVDFGGTASQIVADPTNAANNVVQTTKNAGEPWAGTTVGDQTGFAEPIPFSPGNTSMTVRVWSPVANIPVRLKVENVNNGAIFVETDVMVSVASEWDTLTFNFANQVAGTPALNFASTYNMASIFFDFGTPGSGQIYFWDDVAFDGDGEVPPPPVGGLQFPITFEDEDLDYELVDFGGNVSSIVVDPTDPNNMVVQSLKSEGSATWAGTSVAGVTGFAQPIPFSPENTTMTLRVWSPQANIPVMLKVEQLGDPTVFVEMAATVPVANEWVTLTFDVTNQRPGTAAVNFASTYNFASVFFNIDVMGTGLTYFWDDLDFGGESDPTPGIELPITFEDPDLNYELVDFDGTASVIVADPTDPTNTVVQTTKNTGAPWAGTSVAANSGFAEPIPFSAGNTVMSLRVWSPTAGIPVRLKVEDVNAPTISVETQVNTTVASQWETLFFDFATQADGTAPINFANTYNMATVFFDFLTVGNGEVYFWDDLDFEGEGVTPPSGSIELPITFEDPDLDYELVDFDGTVSEIVVDPTDATNTVVQTTKNTGAPWAGTTVAGTSGFAEPIPFSEGNTIMSLRVWSPTANTPVRLKVEQLGSPALSVETQVNTTVAGEWETLFFDFALHAGGTPAINFNTNYNIATVFFNFMTPGTGEVYFWDDLAFEGGGETPPPSVGLTLPVTFDDEEVNYALIDFGGNASQIVVDPTDATNMVVQSTKTEGAEVFAGTTVGGLIGFEDPLPFSPGFTQMTLRVWSPTANTPVRLKVEDATNGAISVETETLTTVAQQWETLTFNFANAVVGTPAINFNNVYDKATVFFDFGAVGTGATFFWDDLDMDGSITPPVGLVLPITFEDSEVEYGLTDFGGNASEIVVDPTNPNNMVAQTLKTAGALTFAGTTLGGAVGLETPVGFGAGASVMMARVWSPTAGTPVRMKIEDSFNGALSVEAEVNTTVGQAWETLFFNMETQVAGTPAINFANNYDKITLFFNFGAVGAGETYFWDDVDFGVSVGIFNADLKSQAIKVYPNPTSGIINLNMGTNAITNAEIMVTDVSGKLVSKFRVTDQVQQLDFGHLNSGVYFINYMSQGEVVTTKFVKY